MDDGRPKTSLSVHAYVEVSDLERAIGFYAAALGLRLRRRLDSDWVELEGANIPIFLLSDRPPAMRVRGKELSRSFERHWTPVHLDFVTTDLEAGVRRARDAGADLEREIQVREWGRMANMADPFGNGFDLVELAPGGYGRVEAG